MGPDMLARLWAGATSELSREQRHAAAVRNSSNSMTSNSDSTTTTTNESGTSEGSGIVRADGAAVVVVRETPAKVPKLKKHEVLVLVTCPDACAGNDLLEIVVRKEDFQCRLIVSISLTLSSLTCSLSLSHKYMLLMSPVLHFHSIVPARVCIHRVVRSCSQVESVVYRITVPSLVEPGQPFYVRVPKQPTWWTSKASQQNTNLPPQTPPSSLSSSSSSSAPVPVLHPPPLSTLMDEGSVAEVQEANSNAPQSTSADDVSISTATDRLDPSDSSSSISISSTTTTTTSGGSGSTSSSISVRVSSSMSGSSSRRSSGVVAEWSLPNIVGFYAVDGRAIDAKLNALRQWLVEQHARVLRDCYATTPVGLNLRLHQVRVFHQSRAYSLKTYKHSQSVILRRVLWFASLSQYVYVPFVTIRCWGIAWKGGGNVEPVLCASTNSCNCAAKNAALPLLIQH